MLSWIDFKDKALVNTDIKESRIHGIKDHSRKDVHVLPSKDGFNELLLMYLQEKNIINLIYRLMKNNGL
ncbi:hypothetical protein GDO81_005249 [Engystomops pustulosus]|uniref:Uncharacterized protein n=1 Tax=Engystomops pustulosus TaxID=76066 RepID=A0AAV7CM17_ENGPU|nr:hypothetical protein GDO81_005249 [Engystomops pustulosus]